MEFEEIEKIFRATPGYLQELLKIRIFKNNIQYSINGADYVIIPEQFEEIQQMDDKIPKGLYYDEFTFETPISTSQLGRKFGAFTRNIYNNQIHTDYENNIQYTISKPSKEFLINLVINNKHKNDYRFYSSQYFDEKITFEPTGDAFVDFILDSRDS